MGRKGTWLGTQGVMMTERRRPTDGVCPKRRPLPPPGTLWLAMAPHAASLKRPRLSMVPKSDGKRGGGRQPPLPRPPRARTINVRTSASDAVNGRPRSRSTGNGLTATAGYGNAIVSGVGGGGDWRAPTAHRTKTLREKVKKS
jgi:hypothetical protein